MFSLFAHIAYALQTGRGLRWAFAEWRRSRASGREEEKSDGQ